jgi:flagellar basal-body rod protein FlgB
MSALDAQPIFSLLSRALDVASLKQAVHSANIANAGVEGYKRLEVSFDTQLSLARELLGSATDRASMDLPEARVVQAADPTVHLDQEMALMAKDALRYQALLGAVDRTSGLLELAIKEGRESLG